MSFVLGQFVPYPLQCCLNLTETVRDRLLVRFLATYDRLSVCQGLFFEQDPVFIYKSSTFIKDPDAWLWVVACTDRVVRFFDALLQGMYDKYRLRFVSPDVIAFARELGMAM